MASSSLPSTTASIPSHSHPSSMNSSYYSNSTTPSSNSRSSTSISRQSSTYTGRLPLLLSSKDPVKKPKTELLRSGSSFLIPTGEKESKKELRAISSPKMGSLSPNISCTDLRIQPPYPIHGSMRDKLDPVYVEFYNRVVRDNQQVHLQPVEASRTSGVLIPGGGPVLEVGRTEDILIKRRETVGPEIAMRVFTPGGKAPRDGWSSILYFHGGGWVLGNLDTENTVCSHLCRRAECIVVTVDYRLAPENPYPAAVHDSYEALLWLLTTGLKRLNLNPSQTAIGGASAGGNLAGVLTQKLLTYNAKYPDQCLPMFKVQLLMVPVVDNTASVYNNDSWRECEFVPALPAAKMLWFRRHYLPRERSWAEPEASPLLFRDNGDGVKRRWSKLPRALVVVGEYDILRKEGEQYAERLLKSGVSVQLKVMKGMPHPFLAMDGVIQQGRDAITYMVETLRDAFGKSKEV